MGKIKVGSLEVDYTDEKLLTIGLCFSILTVTLGISAIALVVSKNTQLSGTVNEIGIKTAQKLLK